MNDLMAKINAMEFDDDNDSLTDVPTNPLERKSIAKMESEIEALEMRIRVMIEELEGRKKVVAIRKSRLV